MSATEHSLRVAQLVEALESGGAEALAVDIAGELATRGHESHLIVLRGNGPFRRRVAPAVRFHDLGFPVNHGGQLVRLIDFGRTCRSLEAVLRQERIDVVQCHLPKANFLGLAMAWRRAARVFTTIHNNREFEYGEHHSAAKRWLRKTAYRRMLSDCRGVIAVSEKVRQSILADLGAGAAAASRVRVVTNGVRLAPRPTAAERAEARAAWGIAAGEVLVVGVGRLTHQKNFEALLEALALFPDGAPPWRCIIAGEGELAPDLVRAMDARGLASRVRLPGLVGNVAQLLAAADVFCMPSRFEGLPLVLLEAMAAGLPVAAFAIDGISDVVVDGVQARLAPPGDIPALSSTLGALLADAAARRSLGDAGCRLVNERFGFDRVINQLEAAYIS